MRVRRITAWMQPSGRVHAGAECEMDDELALIHIAHGSAEAVEAPEPPAALAPTEPAPPEPPAAPLFDEPPPALAPRKHRHR